VDALTGALAKPELDALGRDAVASGLMPKLIVHSEAFKAAEQVVVAAACEDEATAAARAEREATRGRLVKECEAELEAEMAKRTIAEQAAFLKPIAERANGLVAMLNARAAAGEDVDRYVMDVMPVEEHRPLIMMQAVHAFLRRHKKKGLLAAAMRKQEQAMRERKARAMREKKARAMRRRRTMIPWNLEFSWNF
jgi:hypothetical protein